MKESVCQKNSSGTSSPFMVTDCLGKFFTGVSISRQHVWENRSSEIESLDKATGCLEKLLWTNEWKKKILLKLAPCTEEMKHLPHMEIVVALTKKGKVVDINQVWIG